MTNRKHQELSFKVKVNQFISENGALSDRLADITFLVRSMPLVSLHSFIASNKTVMNVIKWLILAHNLILQTSYRTEEIHELLDQISLENGPFTPMDQILIEKFISPYKSYLYKRNVLQLKEHTGEPQAYHLLNIIRKGVSFIDILYTIGRYLSKQHPFLIDFNIMMAKDAANLYYCLKRKLTEEIAIQNADVLEDINQKLYIVFYNCYFNKSVSYLAPIWISTETLFAKRKANSKKIFKQNVSYKNKDVNKAFCQDFYDDETRNVSLELSDDEPFKSASTIASKNDQTEIPVSRKEFITLAEQLVHIMESKEHCQKDVLSLTIIN